MLAGQEEELSPIWRVSHQSPRQTKIILGTVTVITSKNSTENRSMVRPRGLSKVTSL